MQTNPESAAVEAVARYGYADPVYSDYGYIEQRDDGEFVRHADHQSALDALRGEVADRKARHERTERDACMWAIRAEAAERRVAELSELLEEMRDYVSSALHEERLAFKGYEHCSNIHEMEQDLKRIDAALTKVTP